MNFQEVASLYPKHGPEFKQFVRRVSPPLDMGSLTLSFHPAARRQINMPTTGDASILLSYKGKEGSVLSFGIDDEGQLSILQIQGARGGKGYRVNRGVVIPELYASEIDSIAHHPASGVRRLILPNEIEGLWATESDLAVRRYRVMALRLNMVYSNTEKAFVRDM